MITKALSGDQQHLSGISETLDKELTPLGLRSICMDFGTFKTGFIDSTHHVPYVARIDDYRAQTESYEKLLNDLELNSKQPGDPKKAVEVIVDVVRGEGVAKGRDMPSFLLLGSDAFAMTQAELKRVMKMQEEWANVSKSTDF